MRQESGLKAAKQQAHFDEQDVCYFQSLCTSACKLLLVIRAALLTGLPLKHQVLSEFKAKCAAKPNKARGVLTPSGACCTQLETWMGNGALKIHSERPKKVDFGPVMAAIMAGVVVFAVVSAPAQARRSGKKRQTVTEVIIHATGGPSCARGKVVFSAPGTLKRMSKFFRNSRRVSIHYIVGRDGKIAKGIPENRVAIHARRHNKRSIGIEMINEGDGSKPFPEPQFAALVKLVRRIRAKYAIDMSRIQRHSDVDHSTFKCGGKRVRRKQDPGPAFDWKRFQFELLLAES